MKNEDNISIEINENRSFLGRYFIDLPKKFWIHITLNFWLYVSIVVAIIGLWFFNALVNLVGGFKNALYLIALILSVTTLLWLWKIEAITKVKNHLKKRWYWYILSIFISMFVLYIFEGALLHHYIMIMRENSFMLFFIPLMIYSFKWLIKKETNTLLGKIFTFSFAIIIPVFIASYLYFGGQQYVAQYLKYNDIKDNIIWLDNKPISVNERVFPRDVYKSIAEQSLGDNNVFSESDLILKNNHTKFISSAVPIKKISKFVDGSIDSIIEIPADIPNIDANIQKKKVYFTVGENLVWSRNIYNYAVKSLHYRYFNVFPTNVQILDNEDNKSVMVVSLAKWDGILFPTPEFYGVLIVKQGKISWTKRAILGGSKIILKNDIYKYKWLINQNLNSEISTRYIASTLRFENGFWSALSFVHDNDVLITNMNGDRNELPLISVFNIENKTKLFDFFELKPWKKTSTNARSYLWIPSDGEEKIFGYKPKNVVSIAELTNKVKGSVDYNTEQKYKFAEPRPYFKKDLPELFIISRVLKRNNGSFDPSGIKTYLINASGTQNKVVEVNTYKVDTWEKKAKMLLTKGVNYE